MFVIIKNKANNWPISAMICFDSTLSRNAQALLGAEKGIGSGNMETLLLVFAGIAALAFGVLSAYWACNMLFVLFEIHAAQQRAKAPANVSAQPISV
ncbi:MAG TPA: hypothetical protein VNX22_08425 [Acidobacteriaceae bacterium]|nr:hypothetical protein [Acidobacteriaceae bacterium]